MNLSVMSECALACVQLEAEHTVSLHLRSRRVGSDEAVYSTIDLFSTLLAHLGNRSEQIFKDASPGRKARHAGIQQTLDLAINVLSSSPMAHLVSRSNIVDCTCEAWCPVNMPDPCFAPEGAPVEGLCSMGTYVCGRCS